MDRYVTLAAPAQTVFAYLANPARLGGWVPQIVRVDPGASSLIGLGSAFTVTMRATNGDQDVDTEVAAYEPPWLIAYRLMMATSPVLIRATCTANAEGTRVHVHETDGAQSLVDLARLSRALDPTGAPDHHRRRTP